MDKKTDQGSLSSQLKQWAKITTFHQPFIITHKLYLKRQFGEKIKGYIFSLEDEGKWLPANRLEKEFSRLLKTAGQLDSMCRKSCATEADYVVFDFVCQRVREKAIEVARILQTAGGLPDSSISPQDKGGALGITTSVFMKTFHPCSRQAGWQEVKWQLIRVTSQPRASSKEALLIEKLMIT